MTTQNKVINKVKETFNVIRVAPWGNQKESVVFNYEGTMFAVCEENNGMISVYRAYEDGPDIKFSSRKTGKTFRTVTNFMIAHK